VGVAAGLDDAEGRELAGDVEVDERSDQHGDDAKENRQECITTQERGRAPGSARRSRASFASRVLAKHRCVVTAANSSASTLAPRAV
jgi:hypothetical protein